MINNNQANNQYRFYYPTNGYEVPNYWNVGANINQIINSESFKYSGLKYRERTFLGDINKYNQPLRLIRFKNKLYYRHTIEDEFQVYDKKELELELSTIYGNINIKLVNDLNDVIFSKKNQFRIDTTFISINSIPMVNNEEFNINMQLDIYYNNFGYLVKNHFSYNKYLLERFNNYYSYIKNLNTCKFIVYNDLWVFLF